MDRIDTNKDKHKPTLYDYRCWKGPRRKNNLIGISGPEWIRVWEESGKFAERGNGSDEYCMDRLDKSLPFTVDNVEIITRKEAGRRLVGRSKGLKR